MEEDQQQFDSYVMTFEAWWHATELRDLLIKQIDEGNSAARDQLEALVPILETLHEDYLRKSKLIKDAQFNA